MRLDFLVAINLELQCSAERCKRGSRHTLCHLCVPEPRFAGLCTLDGKNPVDFFGARLSYVSLPFADAYWRLDLADESGQSNMCQHYNASMGDPPGKPTLL